MTLNVKFRESNNMSAEFGSTTIINTGNYDDLFNKPEINDVVVQGKKQGVDYRLQNKMDEMTTQEVEHIFYVGG